MKAAYTGHVAVIRSLIKAGAQANAQDLDGATALLCAAERGMTERDGQHCSSAANRGHLETVRLLLKQGAQPKAVDSSGLSPTDYARSNGYQQVVELLESTKEP